MRKILKYVVLGILLTILLVSCSEIGLLTKDLRSSTKGLDRTIIVTDFMGNEVWTYSGMSFISDKSGFGDITVIYYENGTLKKIDFIGLYNLFAKER